MSAIKQFFVEADQGPLQVEFQEGQARLPVVILCHPHPLYGGSMHDGVLETAANTAQSLGFGWLRFNFRGVGASAGTHIPSADEPAETADLAAVLSWLADNTSHQTYITLGYSFGAYVICTARHTPTCNDAFWWHHQMRSCSALSAPARYHWTLSTVVQMTMLTPGHFLQGIT